jgi:predicted GTPase
MDDGTSARVIDTSGLNKMHNDVLNNQLQNKYSKKIKEFLKGCMYALK